MTDTLKLDWEAPGPVSARFMRSAASVQIINGPIGSGKTTTALMKAITIARRQTPSPRRRAVIEGPNREQSEVKLRMVKVCVVRDTYRQLWKTTIASWWKRIPKNVGDWQGAENGPASHHVVMALGDRTAVDLQVDFIAIGDNAVEDVMRGYEPTFWYLNELDLLSSEVLAYAQGRAGRFPDMADGGPTWHGVLADCNAPEFDSWLWQDPEKDETGRPKPGIFTMTPEQRAALGVELFIQPGGRDPGAENLKNLPAGYYTPKAGQDAVYVARMIDNKPGQSRAGKSVHPEFKMALHVPPQELEPVPGLGLVIGLDPRTNPSAVFMQRLANGQRRFVDELQAEQNTGARRFGKMLADLLHDRFPMVPAGAIRGVCDPSAQYGADREAGEKDWMEIVSAVAGIRIDPAPSNALPVRREALKKPLSELIDGEPAILVSPRCTTLISGLSSGFRFRKLNVPGAVRYADEVEKNHFADICEAAEYACLTDGADLDIRERKEEDRLRLQRMASQAQHDWEPLG